MVDQVINIKHKDITLHDYESGRVNKQFYSNVDITVSESDMDNVRAYLVYAQGTSMTLVNDGVTVLSAVSEIDFRLFPLVLSSKGWSLTGHDIAIGFYG